LVFHVPVRGSLGGLALLCVLSSMCFCALGLLISSRAQTIEAASGLMNAIMLPMWIGSGVFFSAQRFPSIMQPFIKALPLTAVIDALRASMLQGATLAELSPQIAILCGWLVVCFALALKLFRWR
jgi:ABC-type multidrug transport system permease subunit